MFFDICGLACGYYNIEFYTFIKALFIGKSLIKTQLQGLVFIILMKMSVDNNSLYLSDNLIKTNTSNYLTMIYYLWNTIIFSLFIFFIKNTLIYIAELQLNIRNNNNKNNKNSNKNFNNINNKVIKVI